MVATLSAVSSSKNAGKYFYFTENDFECSKSWHANRAKEELNLKSLNRKSFENVLDGKLSKDNILGRQTKDGLKHHPGQELILSAPKSVSIMALVAKDERVIDAHEKAVSTTLNYMQRHMLCTRIQEKGRQYLERTDNAPIAKFIHMTSRASKSLTEKEVMPDPQLHTHNIIANATLCQDSKWRSIVFDSLYENQLNIGELYRMELAREVEKIGYETELSRNKAGRWTFEIKGVSDKDIKELSQRRQNILKEAEKIGDNSTESLVYLAKITREEKAKYSQENLRANWISRVDIDSISKLKDEADLREQTNIAKQKGAIALEAALENAIASLSEREATFKPEDLHAAVIENTGKQYSISQIEEVVAQKLESGFILKSKSSETSTYTTAKNLQLEKDTIKMMLDGQNRVKAILPKKEIQQFLKDTNLNHGQKDALTLMLNSKDRVIGVQGVAGTAKTTMLNASRALAGVKGYEFIGLAPTRGAANVLSKVVGINTQTLHMFLAKHDGVIKGRGKSSGREQMQADFRNKIVILDESSLASTRHIKNLLTLSQELKFRLVLVGDTKQLGAVESGKPFDILQSHGMNTAILRDIKRQQNDNLLKAVYAAAGSVDQDKTGAREGIYAALKRIGRENIHDLAAKTVSSQELVEATYQAWIKESNPSTKEILVVAPSNFLRKAINSKIRTHFVKGTEVTKVILQSKNLTHAQSQNIANYNKEDVILFNKENPSFNIEKDSYYRVLEINERDGSLLLNKLNQDDEVGVKWSPIKALANNTKGLVEVYKKEELQLAIGEVIRWTKNSKNHKFIVNGDTASIQNITSSQISFKVGDSIYKFSKNDPDLMHMDHAYCSTVYASQGKTVDRVIGIARSRESLLDLTTQRSFYVTLSRAREKAILVTDNYKGLIRRLSEKTGAKSSAIEHQTINTNHIENAANFKHDGRAVFIEKDSNKTERESDKVANGRKSQSSVSEAFDSFINNPNRVRTVAIRLFGEINNRLSRGDNLRFGKNGSIAVNMRSGKWYNFSLGEGGNLYSLAKNNKLLNYISKSQENIEVTSKNSIQKRTAALTSINQLIQTSIAISQEHTIANAYLETHRKINLKAINLSNDLCYTEKAWSSETNSAHPALIAIARDKDTKPTAVQSIYLDPDTANKNKNLEISKRSQGILKGSFVELTKNIDAKIIFIAEGIETSLSIANVAPEERVICSLGISNIKNIDLSRTQSLINKTIIICADNDGKDSSTKVMVEQASDALKKQGAKAVAIIRPDIEGQDFNDVLKLGKEKVEEYIKPLLNTYPDYQKKDISLKQKLGHLKQEESILKKALGTSSVYKDVESAIHKWQKLVEDKGISEASKQIKASPDGLGPLSGLSLLGFKTIARIEASGKINSFLEMLAALSANQKSYTECIQQNKDLCAEITDKHLKKISEFSTKGFDHKEIAFKLEKVVQHSLAAIDKIIDYKDVKLVTSKMTEQIILYRQKYREEPTEPLKKQYFLRARYELSRQGFIEKYLNQAMPKNSLESRVLRAENLERLLGIDSKLAQENTRNQIYYEAPEFAKVLEQFKEGEGKIAALTYSFVKQGMDNIKSNFIATEVIKYEEITGQFMPLKQQESLKSIGDYVSKNYNDLLKYGFNKDEARIAYIEGSKLALSYVPTVRDLEISKSDIKLTQEDIKRTIARHGQTKAIEQNMQPTIKPQLIECGRRGMEIEL